MSNKIHYQCSNCGAHEQTLAVVGGPEGMFYLGYRAHGDVLYCPDCVKTWKERNGEEYDEQYKDAQHLFTVWWNRQMQITARIDADKGVKIMDNRINQRYGSRTETPAERIIRLYRSGMSHVDITRLGFDLADVRRVISEATAKDKTLYPMHRGMQVWQQKKHSTPSETRTALSRTQSSALTVLLGAVAHQPG
jgi:hypothetical protein